MTPELVAGIFVGLFVVAAVIIIVMGIANYMAVLTREGKIGDG